MGEVVFIKGSLPGHQALRNIADEMEAGHIESSATVICGTDVYHVGEPDDGVSARDAVFNMTIGIAKLSSAALNE